MLKEKFIQLISSYSKDERYNLYCWKEIEEKYSSKSRYYHNLEHLENILKELDEVKTQILNLDSLIFAVYYHDIIYTATKSDNEVQSSLLFQKRITKTSFPYIQECRRAIEATKEHKFSEDHDTNLLLDCDLSILGKGNSEYTIHKKYTQGVSNLSRFYVSKRKKKSTKKHISIKIYLQNRLLYSKIRKTSKKKFRT